MDILYGEKSPDANSDGDGKTTKGVTKRIGSTSPDRNGNGGEDGGSASMNAMRKSMG